MITVLKEPKNALIKQYQKLFAMEDVEIEFQEDALLEIARRAILKKSGARGLRSILEQALLDTMYILPSREDLHKVIVDVDVIKSKTEPTLIFDKANSSAKRKAKVKATFSDKTAKVAAKTAKIVI